MLRKIFLTTLLLVVFAVVVAALIVKAAIFSLGFSFVAGLIFELNLKDFAIYIYPFVLFGTFVIAGVHVLVIIIKNTSKGKETI